MELGVRKCLLKKWPDFSGYGFNLHAEKGKSGQYIGVVDKNSPALAAGLKQGDRIIEVNGETIGEDSHQAVVDRIRKSGSTVWLLVVDKDTDASCKDNNVVITESMEGVKVNECPDSNPYASDSAPESPMADTAAATNGDKTEEPAAPPDADYENRSDSPDDLPELNGGGTDDVETEQDDEDLPPPPPELTSELPADPVEQVSTDPEPAAAEPANAALVDTNSIEHEPQENTTPDKPPEQSPPPAEPVAPEPEKQEEVKENVEKPPTAETKVEPTVDSMKKMSVAEMKEALKNKKKVDPRSQKKSAVEKLAEFQKL